MYSHGVKEIDAFSVFDRTCESFLQENTGNMFFD